MKILFEDENLIVCVKPRGLLSQSDDKGRENMISLLSDTLKSEIFPLHRLDKEVGGVMVYAKTRQSAANLSKQIAEHNFKKQYIAMIHGKPTEREGNFFDLLFKDSKKNKSFVVKKERKGVKPASLDYETLSSDDNTSKVLITLHTGRTHQIRVQFASRKMPLIGDKKYGASDDEKIIGLWSYKITFTHPVTKEALSFTCDPDF